MAYQPIKYLSANGVFHTDGIGVNPNDPTNSYRSLNPATPDEFLPTGSATTAGKITLTEFNQKAQFSTNGIGVSPNDATQEYGSVLRQRS